MKRKTTVSIFLILCFTALFGQQSDSLGINNNPFLNKQEIEFFNNILQDKRDDFDFKDKRVAFVTGKPGGMILTKKEYFNRCVKPWTTKGSKPQIFMTQLTKNEKVKSGGYDAIVLSWVKIFSDRQKRKIINQLGGIAKPIKE